MTAIEEPSEAPVGGSRTRGARWARVVETPAGFAGLAATAVTVVLMLTDRDPIARGIYGHSDAPSYFAVAQSPLGRGVAIPLGASYRYGRILLPFAGWVLALGHAGWVPWTLAFAFALSAGFWFATTAEFADRFALPRWSTAWLLAVPFVLLWMNAPEVVGEPLAAALLLATFLSYRDRNERRARWLAALAVLARETCVLAVIPLVVRAWRTDGWRAAARWIAMVVGPYAAWSAWVLVRVGHVPLLDPAKDRRRAFVAPFTGWFTLLRHQPARAQSVALILVAITIIASLAVFAVSPRGHRDLAAAAALYGLIGICFGPSVWNLPTEGLRVLAPGHALLLVGVFELVAARRTVSPPQIAAAADREREVSASER